MYICRTDVVLAVLGCPGYQSSELMLDKVVELLQKGTTLFLLNAHIVLTFVVAEELKKELREKQINLNSIKLDTNLFEGNYGYE